MLFGSHGAVYTASICSTVSLMATIIILPMIHTQFQRKMSLMLSNVELCKLESRDIWKQMSFKSRRRRSSYEADSNPYGAASYSGSGSCSKGHQVLEAQRARMECPAKTDRSGKTDTPEGPESTCPPLLPVRTPARSAHQVQMGRRVCRARKVHEDRLCAASPARQGRKEWPVIAERCSMELLQALQEPPDELGRVGSPAAEGTMENPACPAVPALGGAVGDRGTPGNAGLPGPPGPPGEPGLPGSCNHCQGMEGPAAPAAAPYDQGRTGGQQQSGYDQAAAPVQSTQQQPYDSNPPQPSGSVYSNESPSSPSPASYSHDAPASSAAAAGGAEAGASYNNEAANPAPASSSASSTSYSENTSAGGGEQPAASSSSGAASSSAQTTGRRTSHPSGERGDGEYLWIN
ncbi:Col-cuticle-N domain-containing protein [Aphelenchoides fujianensis]|nr:Col-cuticle-N domain-containing protein [Aphelenchoides fujianensis]